MTSSSSLPQSLIASRIWPSSLRSRRTSSARCGSSEPPRPSARSSARRWSRTAASDGSKLSRPRAKAWRGMPSMGLGTGAGRCAWKRPLRTPSRRPGTPHERSTLQRELYVWRSPLRGQWYSNRPLLLPLRELSEGDGGALRCVGDAGSWSVQLWGYETRAVQVITEGLTDVLRCLRYEPYLPARGAARRDRRDDRDAGQSWSAGARVPYRGFR